MRLTIIYNKTVSLEIAIHISLNIKNRNTEVINIA